MADDILLAERLVVVEDKIVDAGHGELERNLASTRSAPSDQHLCLTDQADIVELLNALKKSALAVHRLFPFAARSRCAATCHSG